MDFRQENPTEISCLVIEHSGVPTKRIESMQLYYLVLLTLVYMQLMKNCELIIQYENRKFWVV